MKRVVIVVLLISLILVALFMAAKPGIKIPIPPPHVDIPQSASPSVAELPPTTEQQEALVEASSTLTPVEITSAQLTDKTNIVEYKQNGISEWKDAQINQKFMNGDTLRTGADSEAQLSFSDGSTVRLNGLTQITINPADKEINLSIGKIFVSFFRGTASPKVVTPNAVAAALGTMWVQEQKEDGTSQINVLEGQVNFTSEGSSEIVDEGNFTKALPKKPPVKPQKFNIDNYAQSEKVLKKVRLKKLVELHKNHDTAFQEKLKEHPELFKKYEEKTNRLKVEKKEVIEKKLEEKKELKPQIKEKIEEKKFQQNENIKKQLEDKKAENAENKKEVLKENLEEKKFEEKKELKPQIKEKIEDRKLQQNENIKKQLEDKKAENTEKKKELLKENFEEKKLQHNEKIKKQIEEKGTKTQEIKKKPVEENKKSQVQEDNKKKVDDKKNQEIKKKLIDEKKF